MFLLLTTVRLYKDIKILALLSATCRTSELDGPKLNCFYSGKKKNGELHYFLQKKMIIDFIQYKITYQFFYVLNNRFQYGIYSIFF